MIKGGDGDGHPKARPFTVDTRDIGAPVPTSTWSNSLLYSTWAPFNSVYNADLSTLKILAILLLHWFKIYYSLYSVVLDNREKKTIVAAS